MPGILPNSNTSQLRISHAKVVCIVYQNKVATVMKVFFLSRCSPGFFKLLLSMKSVCVYDSMCMYVCRALKNYLGLENSQLNKFCAVFSFFIWHLPSILWKGMTLVTKLIKTACEMRQMQCCGYLSDSVSKEDAFKVFYIGTKAKRFSYKGEQHIAN